jgi:hypothetical protein
MGVTDKQLKEHWGSEILQANAAADDKRVIDKLYGRLVRRGDPAAEHPIKSKAVADTISKMELDPEVTERTLGFPHKNITPEAILATTNKLIRVSRGDVDPDDRDHLAFQTLYGPEDLLGERFAKDKSFLRQLLWRATTKGNLSHVQPGALTKQLHAALLHSGLGQAAEEINPGELLDAQTSVTRLGSGGIPNMEAVPDESRSVQPSHFAFIDPIRTPECHDQLSEVMTKSGWRPWPEVTMTEEFACLIDGRLEYHRPEHLYAAPYRGTMYGVRSEVLDYLVTPNHRMYVRSCVPARRSGAWNWPKRSTDNGATLCVITTNHTLPRSERAPKITIQRSTMGMCTVRPCQAGCSTCDEVRGVAIGPEIVSKSESIPVSLLQRVRAATAAYMRHSWMLGRERRRTRHPKI